MGFLASPLPMAWHLLITGLGSGGGFERLHYLLESFFDADGDINPAFMKAGGGGSQVGVVSHIQVALPCSCHPWGACACCDSTPLATYA